MQYFTSIDGHWFAENVPLSTIAKDIGTPCYVYSKAALQNTWHAFDDAFLKIPHQVNYAVKANSNLAVLNILSGLGSGFDIVSGGELARVLKAGGDPKKITFSGVGKTKEELTFALNQDIGCINVESKAELLRLQEIAMMLGKKANIAFRVNPDVDSKSHPYIATGLKENKFGITIAEAKTLYPFAQTLSHIQTTGIAFHIGSQILSLSPILDALDKILNLGHHLQSTGIMLNHLNVGGGLGVCYREETPPTPEAYVAALLSHIKHLDLIVQIEPGRAIAAHAGVLLTRVEYIKPQGCNNQYLAIVDAAMNDFLRPALYGAWHDIIPVNTYSQRETLQHTYDIVGPVCETADFLGNNRLLSLEAGDLLLISAAGAYGFSMSSNYNSRPRPAEVMVDGNQFTVVRARETLTDLFEKEKYTS